MMQMRSLNIGGISLNGNDPIPDDIRAYFESFGTQVFQINGYIILEGPVFLSGSDIRKKLPHYFSRYNIEKEIWVSTYSGWWSWFGGKTHLFDIGSSVSKTTGAVKSWAHKPLGNDYEMRHAVKDVFIANLCRSIFDEKFIHKAKFDHIGMAVFTRLPDNDNPRENTYKFNKLSNFLDDNYNHKNYLSQEQRNNLLNYLIVGLLSDVRTLNVEDMACIELKSTRNKQLPVTLKTVFHINGAAEDLKYKSQVSFESLLPKLHTEFKSVYDIILSDNIGWNNKKYTNHNLDKSFVERCRAEFSDGITQEDFEASINEIIAVISHNNYELFDTIKAQILCDLNKKNSKFADDKVLDIVTNELDSIVMCIKQNIDAYLQFNKSQSLTPSLRLP